MRKFCDWLPILRGSGEYKHHPLRQLFKFCVVGLGGALINYVLFFVYYHYLGMNHVTASSLSYLSAGVYAFFFNRNWTFLAGDGRISLQFVFFVALNALSLGANGVTIYLCADVFGVPVVFAQLCAMFVTTVLNFLGGKFFVFTPRESAG